MKICPTDYNTVTSHQILIKNINFGIHKVKFKEQSWRIHTPCYKAKLLNAVWYWHTEGHEGRWDRIGSLEINPQMISEKRTDTT